MRVVLDANIYVSSLISQLGYPHQIVDRWLERAFDVLITRDILDEVGRILRYPRIVRQHRLEEADIAQYMARLAQFGVMVWPTETVNAIPKDESDNRYLECALAGKADYIVTGEDHLLALETFRGVHILNPAAFVALVRVIDSGERPDIQP